MHRWLEGGEAPRNHDHDVERASEELKKLGIPLEVMGEWGKSEAKPKIEALVLPLDLRMSVHCFVACATQWEYCTPGLGKPILLGLNYSRLESVMRMKGVAPEDVTTVFEDVRLMEAVALPLMSA